MNYRKITKTLKNEDSISIEYIIDFLIFIESNTNDLIPKTFIENIISLYEVEIIRKKIQNKEYTLMKRKEIEELIFMTNERKLFILLNTFTNPTYNDQDKEYILRILKEKHYQKEYQKYVLTKSKICK